MNTINKDIRQMFKWSIKKALKDHPDELLNRKELQEIISNIWDELVQCGDIHIVR